MIRYSVVVPVYNTQEVLFKLVNNLTKVLKSENEPFEIILIDDCSPQKSTWDTISSISLTNDHVVGVKLTRNFGQQSATLCGLSLAKGDYIFTMDDDLQHNPEDLPKLLAKKDHDIVIAQFSQKQHSFSKRLTSRIKGYFDYKILGKPKGIQLSAFRLLKAHIVKGMLAIKTPTPFIPALMLYVSRDIVAVDLEHHKRMEGESGYTLRKLLKLFSFLLINNSSLLLRLIGNIGLVLAGFSFLVVCYLLISKLVFNQFVAGWTSTIVALFFFGGIQLFTLGIIGEYLIRIIRNVEEKPPFLIDKIVTSAS